MRFLFDRLGDYVRGNAVQVGEGIANHLGPIAFAQEALEYFLREIGRVLAPAPQALQQVGMQCRRVFPERSRSQSRKGVRGRARSFRHAIRLRAAWRYCAQIRGCRKGWNKKSTFFPAGPTIRADNGASLGEL